MQSGNNGVPDNTTYGPRAVTVKTNGARPPEAAHKSSGNHAGSGIFTEGTIIYTSKGADKPTAGAARNGDHSEPPAFFSRIFGSGKRAAAARETLEEAQGRVRNFVKLIGEKAAGLSSTEIETRNIMDNSVAAIREINAKTEEIESKSAMQTESVVKNNAAVNGIISGIENLNRDIETQAEGVSESSASIEAMVSNITMISADLAQNEKDLTQLRKASSEGNTALRKMSTDIQEVSKESERLLEINKVIEDIAAQTNLLAMNAAIEAAHAGESGRGFAVVAAEIRKLAESSNEQAKTVAAVLKNVKNALGNISESTLASLKQFDDIDRGFENVSAQSMEIRNAMEEQDAGNRKILAAMAASSEITRHVLGNSSEIKNAGREIAAESKNLENLSGEMTHAIHEIASDIENITAAVTRTSETGRKNRENIDSLIQEAEKFVL